MIKQRFLAFLMAVLMLAPMIVSCSENEVNTDTDKPEQTAETTEIPNAEETVEVVPEETELTDGLEDVNMEGYNFRLMTAIVDGVELADFMTSEEMTGESLNDAAYESHIYLEDRFNIDFTLVEAGNIVTQAVMTQNSVLANTDDFDTVISHDWISNTTFRKGTFCNLLNFDEFDFSKPWWPKGTCDNLTVANRMYFASNYASYCGLAYCLAYNVNKDIAADLNIEIPYDAVREGTWTFDTLLTLTENAYVDKNGDGAKDPEDQYGLTAGGHSWYSAQRSCGLEFYPKDENGKLYLNVDLERVTKYVDYVRNIINNQQMYYGDDYFSYGEHMFSKGKSLFGYTRLSDSYIHYRNCEFSYGFLPTPKMDELQENYVNAGTDHMWSIPLTVVSEDHRTKVATIMEAMSCYNYKNLIPAYMEITMKTKLADSPDDAEMLQIIADTREFIFEKFYCLEHHQLFIDLIDATKEPASYFASLDTSAKTILNNFLAEIEGLPE